ncbi:hypothetical protein CICLE_v10026833mg [Citrus x clementina]|uniref:Uncharacterized protein n=1 Tax=Citrus clementina TaxID=85681 RepID=V4UJA4_CITCL|nr:hypothetical protein CICLE_v10026833mg [Citrus x clementina]
MFLHNFIHNQQKFITCVNRDYSPSRWVGRQKKTVGVKCQQGDKKAEIEVGLPGGAVTGSFNLTLLLTFSFFLNYLCFSIITPLFFFFFFWGAFLSLST